MTVLSSADPRYPSRLLDLPRPPDPLWYEGDPTLLSRECVAIVGTRRMTPYGERVARELAIACADAGVVVVSGLARSDGLPGAERDETESGCDGQRHPPGPRAIGRQGAPVGQSRANSGATLDEPEASVALEEMGFERGRLGLGKAARNVATVQLMLVHELAGHRLLGHHIRVPEGVAAFHSRQSPSNSARRSRARCFRTRRVPAVSLRRLAVSLLGSSSK